MKKNFLFAACMAATMAVSCSKDEGVAVDQAAMNPDAIGYSTYVGNVMRSIVSNCGDLQGTDFSVYGFYVDGDTQFMGSGSSDGANIVYTDGAWGYEDPNDKSYWSDKFMNFYAYAPTQSETVGQFIPNITNTSATISYETVTSGLTKKADMTKQVDMLYSTVFNANRDDRKGDGTGQSSGALGLCFKHAFAQILFSAKSADANFKVDISSISLNNVLKSGVFTLPAPGATADDDATPASWSATTQGARCDYTIDFDDVTAIDNTEAKPLTTTANGAILLMPQVLTPWTTTVDTAVPVADIVDESYLAISCKIYDAESGGYLIGDADSYATVNVPFGEKIAMGTIYTYTIIFGDTTGGSGGGGYDDKGEELLSDFEISFMPGVCGWSGTVTEDLTI